MKNMFFKAGAVALGSLLAIPVLAGAANAAPSAVSASPAVAAGAAKFSFGCNTYPARANFSYNPGAVTTTVYYNNHCSHSVSVFVKMSNHKGTTVQCWSIPKKASGSKKFQQGAVGTFDSISKGC